MTSIFLTPPHTSNTSGELLTTVKDMRPDFSAGAMIDTDSPGFRTTCSVYIWPLSFR